MRPNGTHISRFLAAFVTLVIGVACGASLAQSIDQFALPPGIAANDIIAGADGNLWFTETLPGRIGRINPAGVITEFPIPTEGSKPQRIASGLDGNIWFTENWFTESAAFVGGGAKIGRITADGVMTEFPLPSAISSAQAITTGPGGGIWFAETSANEFKIARFTTGTPTEFATPGGSPNNLVSGPDGALWFTQNVTIRGRIGRMTTKGAITTFELSGFANHASGIAAGPDGNLWFTESANKIGRITPQGVITEFAVPTPGSSPHGIATGADGDLWFTEAAAGKIGRITTDGVITEFPARNGSPLAIAPGPDGTLWFTESSGTSLGRITIITTSDGSCLSNSLGLCLSGGRFRATATYSNPGGSGVASASRLSDSSGFFTFDNPDSVELVVKVLNACGFTPSIWVFAAGLTDQEVLLTVTDTKKGEVRTYANPLGTKFVTVTDTAAFSTCP